MYSSFLRHAETASKTYGVDTRDILVELGRRRMVGGQEDMIVDVALDLANQGKAGGKGAPSTIARDPPHARSVVREGTPARDITEERFARIAAEAARVGGFTALDFETREASRRAVLAQTQPGDDVWVFAYGSLMWNPAFHCRERRAGCIYGYHRSFCLWTPLGRGSPTARAWCSGSIARLVSRRGPAHRGQRGRE